MLRNRPIQRFTNDLDKRWMSDDFFDLVVWYEAEGRMHGFQLSYDKPGRERALTWMHRSGYLHAVVDTGESEVGAHSLMSPVLTHADEFPFDAVYREFMRRSLQLDPGIRQFVMNHIIEYGCRQQTEWK